jgi:hypothetical protein
LPVIEEGSQHPCGGVLMAQDPGSTSQKEFWVGLGSN